MCVIKSHSTLSKILSPCCVMSDAEDDDEVGRLNLLRTVADDRDLVGQRVRGIELVDEGDA